MKAVRIIFAFLLLAALAVGIWYSCRDPGFYRGSSESSSKDRNGSEVVERTYYLLDDAKQDLRILPHGEVGRVDLRAWMAEIGVDPSAIGEVHYDPSDNKVVARGSPDQIDMASVIFDGSGCTGFPSGSSEGDRLRKICVNVCNDWWVRTTWPIRERFFPSTMGIHLPPAVSLNPSPESIPGLPPVPAPIELPNEIVK